MGLREIPENQAIDVNRQTAGLSRSHIREING